VWLTNDSEAPADRCFLLDGSRGWDAPNKVQREQAKLLPRYRRIPTLQEYLLINQHEVMVDVFYRREADLWETYLISGLDGVVQLRSLGCELHLADLYRLGPGLGQEGEQGNATTLVVKQLTIRNSHKC